MPAVPSYTDVPPGLVWVFVAAMAEAQLLEAALKNAVRLDLKAFGKPEEVPDLLQALERITLGGAIKLSQGTATHSPEQKTISSLVGFAQFIPLQTGLAVPEIHRRLADALTRRNAIAHHYLVDIINLKMPEAEAFSYLSKSAHAFAELKEMVAAADFLSSKMGGIASSGETLPRLPRL